MKAHVASDLRDMNRKSVFNYIASQDEVSRTMITQITGISGPTVLKIASFLLEEGLVLEMGERSDTVGRKPQMLKINKNRKYGIGVVLEGAYIRAGIVNLAGDVLLVESAKTKNMSLEKIMTEIIPPVVDVLIQKSGVEREDVLGVGLGLPCSYDEKEHKVCFAPLIQIFENTNIKQFEEQLSLKCQMPLVIDNDVNMSVFGEYRIRGLENEDFAYISIGTGLGAGIILDGKLRHGSNAQCGEIGYMVFENDYIRGTDRAGWLERTINLEALNEKFGFDCSHPEESDLKIVGDYVADKIALCITNFASILDCGTVCLSGILSECLGDEFIKSVQKVLDTINVIHIDLQKPICKEAGIVGASLQIIDRELGEILMK